jgi:hypothetical protein
METPDTAYQKEFHIAASSMKAVVTIFWEFQEAMLDHIQQVDVMINSAESGNSE